MIVEASIGYVVDFLFIVSNTGVPYVIHDSREIESIENTEQPDPILVSGFLSAIQEFLKGLTNKDLKVIDGGTQKIIIHRTEYFSVAAVSEMEYVNTIMEILIDIGDTFLNEYYDEMTSNQMIADLKMFDRFYPQLYELISLDKLLVVNSNDIYRRIIPKLIELPRDGLEMNFGSELSQVILHIDGRRTLYQILDQLELFGTISNLDTKIMALVKLGILKKLPEGQRQLQIISSLFQIFIEVVSDYMSRHYIRKYLQEVVNESNNHFSDFIHTSENFIDFTEILLGVTENPTLALHPDFQKIINLVIDFIAKIQINFVEKIDEINGALRSVIYKFLSSFPADQFVSNFTEKLEFMVI